ncbi:DNA-binding protein [Endozoicomonas montiporae]|uniref:DNA-binding protein n=1 Tax=Endozoicomonas montiporae TaxID=1027273 RepID=A0A081N071_9GAMM|nr:DNA-binding protein [Endozoicomonas montiporae]
MTRPNTEQEALHQQEWQELRQWLLLSFISGLGAVRYRALLKEFGHPESILNATYDQLRAGLPDKLARCIAGKPETSDISERIEHTRNWLESSEAHHIIPLSSPAYPVRLKEISDAPPLIYVIGNPKLLSEPQLAIVGSRRPTPQGRRLAHDLALELGKSGLVITSGLALGIDAAAHQGVLSSYGSTVAVLGTGVDQIYPRNHQSLYSLIAQQGAIVSEFPLGTSASPGHFPRRNRIISGLSLGVLVVEAEQKSGSLISARLAAEQGRDVFAVPGSVLNPLSKGCHQLLREGAVLVESHEDVLLELQPQLEPMLDETDPEPEIVSDAINSQHLHVLDCMGFDVASMDLLSQVSGLPCAELSVVLTELEMEGLVQSVPGGFVRVR